MEQGKRPLEGGAQREAKKQQTENTLVFGKISLPEGPAVDFKERLAKPLGKAMVIVGGGASSQQHRLTVKKVLASRIKPHVVKYLSKMPSYEMLLPPFVPRATPIQSEAIANADMQTNLFDLVNYVFRQLPDDSGFYKQYAILMNPLKRDTKALTDALKAIWHHSGASGAKGDRPDNLLLRTWNAEGSYEAQPDSLYSFEGKQLDVFGQYFNDEEVESGNLELADNWEELG